MFQPGDTSNHEFSNPLTYWKDKLSPISGSAQKPVCGLVTARTIDIAMLLQSSVESNLSHGIEHSRVEVSLGQRFWDRLLL
jgi:hypothetical protein